MKNAALIVAVFALPVVLAAFAVGWTLSGLDLQGSPVTPPPQPVASTSPAEEAAAPPRAVADEDVPGRDLAELSRPPGSTRVGYRQEQLEGFARTRLEYVTDASADEIRTFYRESFASGGWVVADLGFSPAEWYFFVIKDEREALVEIHALQEPVVVEIELTDPDQTPASNAPIPQPVDPVPTPPLGDAGDDDDSYKDDAYGDDAYEGEDD